MSETAISWTDRTWNVVTGCEKVSPGCGRCYAQTLHNSRYKANVKAALPQLPFVEPGANVVAYARRNLYSLPFPATYDTPFAVVNTHPKRLMEPLRVKKPQKWFTCSMGDLFHEDVPDEFLDRMFAVMALTPQHTYQVLTKRPGRLREYLSADVVSGTSVQPRAVRIGLAMRSMSPERHTPQGIVAYRDVSDGRTWPLPNVWIGTSVEDQERADERIPELLATPAAVRFLSCEPLLGPLDLDPLCMDIKLRAFGDGDSGIDWVIVGGESGPRFRPMETEWALSLLHQCDAAGVAFWAKQGSGRKSEQPFGHPELDGARAFPAGVS